MICTWHDLFNVRMFQAFYVQLLRLSPLLPFSRIRYGAMIPLLVDRVRAREAGYSHVHTPVHVFKNVPYPRPTRHPSRLFGLRHWAPSPKRMLLLIVHSYSGSCFLWHSAGAGVYGGHRLRHQLRCRRDTHRGESYIPKLLTWCLLYIRASVWFCVVLIFN